MARKPVTGMIPAGAALLLTLVPPMEAGEVPVYFCPLGVGALEMTVIDPSRVSLQNMTAMAAPFALGTAANGLLDAAKSIRTKAGMIDFLRRRLLAPQRDPNG